MRETNFTIVGRDGESIFVYKWFLEGKQPKAI